MKKLAQGAAKAEENLYVLAPPPVLPFGSKYRVVNKINQWFISRTVKRALKECGGGVPDIFTFLPSAVDLLSFIDHGIVVYDCVDDHAAFTGLINADVVYQMEKELMARADVSFATARQLYEDRKGWSGNFHIIPNGAEYEHFACTGNPPPVPEDCAGFHPVAGFVGGISDWVDVDLIAAAAHSCRVTLCLSGRCLLM